MAAEGHGNADFRERVGNTTEAVGTLASHAAWDAGLISIMYVCTFISFFFQLIIIYKSVKRRVFSNLWRILYIQPVHIL